LRVSSIQQWPFTAPQHADAVPREGVSLTCKPSLDRTTNDPVIDTDVRLTFAPNSNYQNKEFNVVHHTFGGRSYDRTKQYEASSLCKKPNRAEWHWQGTSYLNPNRTMLAELFHNLRNEWWYVEKVFKYDRLDQTITERCEGE
jgi:hypothetical protein